MPHDRQPRPTEGTDLSYSVIASSAATKQAPFRPRHPRQCDERSDEAVSFNYRKAQEIASPALGAGSQ